MHKNHEIQVRHLYAAADLSIGFFLKKTTCTRYKFPNASPPSEPNLMRIKLVQRWNKLRSNTMFISQIFNNLNILYLRDTSFGVLWATFSLFPPITKYFKAL